MTPATTAGASKVSQQARSSSIGGMSPTIRPSRVWSRYAYRLANVPICKMIERFDTERGRHYYSRRMGTVEPVFANITSTLGLNRFSLRGRVKVDTQWKLYCTVHNIGKIAGHRRQ